MAEVKLGLLVCWAFAVGWYDWHERRIPNVLSLSPWGLAPATFLASGHSWTGADWTSATIGALLAFVLTLPAYAWRKLGAGDVKFLVSIALLTSWQQMLHAFAVAGLIAGFAAILWLTTENLLLTPMAERLSSRVRATLLQWFTHKPKLPFGTFLTIGLCSALLHPH